MDWKKFLKLIQLNEDFYYRGAYHLECYNVAVNVNVDEQTITTTAYLDDPRDSMVNSIRNAITLTRTKTIEEWKQNLDYNE